MKISECNVLLKLCLYLSSFTASIDEQFTLIYHSYSMTKKNNLIYRKDKIIIPWMCDTYKNDISIIIFAVRSCH